jgi:cyclin-dependent kinase regulatory subunit CKS1
VTIPQSLVALLPTGKRLLSECEWRAIGVQQSRGWEHYYTFADEPHVLPFRRRLH